MAEAERGVNFLIGAVVASAIGVLALILTLANDGFGSADAWSLLLLAAPFLVGIYLAAAARVPVLRTFWEIPVIATLGGFMLWVRMLPAKALVLGDRAYYIGTDPFFHYRETLGIVRSFPSIPRWDPWTFYPHGTATNQFGTLFDWAAAAWVVLTQGKDAPEVYVQQVLGVYPAILGALLIIPFFFLAKRLLGTAGAIVASLTIALLPGEFLIRGIAGYSDHHVAEALMALISILGVYVAAERGHEAREALRARDWMGLRKAIAFGVLGGLALGLNFYAWPPALLFLAILTLWLTVVILLETARGNDPGGLAFGAALSFGIAGLMMIPVMETRDIADFNAYGPLQILAPLGAAAGLVALWAISSWAQRAGKARLVAISIGLVLATTGLAIAFALRPEEFLLTALLFLLAAGVVAGFAAMVVAERRDRKGLIIAGGGVGLAAIVVTATAAMAGTNFFASMKWGLSWITGIGVPRTLLTISEARSAAFFCSSDTQTYSCLATDFGLVAPVSFLLLLALVVVAIWKRRHADILLLIWSLFIFRATDTQIRFSYYLAINMALLIGWAAARVAEAVGFEDAPGTKAETPVAEIKRAKGRKVKHVEAQAARSRPLQAAAVASVALLVFPGNVLASENAFPGWESALIRSPDGDLALWLEGLDWMRENTPDAGMDLGLIVKRPDHGIMYDYPERTYGVLSWWDYGHWIETTALRPPVANPFQQAAPFASLWFTERDPAAAEVMLDDWVDGTYTGIGAITYTRPDTTKGPVRYVWIDDEMATGKYGAITVWANSQNASRPTWGSGNSFSQRPLEVNGETRNVLQAGPAFTETMMSRLYDRDGNGLPNYRLVYEHPAYVAIGNVAWNDGSGRCVHDVIPSRSCPVTISNEAIRAWDADPSRAVTLGDDAHAYDVDVQSRLKLFERVEGARLTGTVGPGVRVEAAALVAVEHDNGNRRQWEHRVSTIADANGNFELRFPYSNVEPLGPDAGGTNGVATLKGRIFVQAGALSTEVDVPERSVLEGLSVPVDFIG